MAKTEIESSAIMLDQAWQTMSLFTREGWHTPASACSRCCAQGVYYVDTDVMVVFAVALLNKMAADELWVVCYRFLFRITAVHDIVAGLNPTLSNTVTNTPSLSRFHCVWNHICICRQEKNTPWKTWNSFPEVKNDFRVLIDMPNDPR